jgi:hypothetical protein
MGDLKDYTVFRRSLLWLRSKLLLLLLVLVLLILDSRAGATALPSPAEQLRYDQLQYLQRRANDSAPAIEPLPPHHWELAKHWQDIDFFRQKYNLTLVSSKPQEAALMPSWPQAFVQYILIAPPISCSSAEYVDGVKIHTFPWFTLFTSIPLFVAWTVSFGMLESAKATAGWISVLGWSAWMTLLPYIGPFALPPLLFQWAASCVIIIQRWKGTIGTVAYQISESDLHGCTPVDGLSYLEIGARARPYRIFQTASFAAATVFSVTSISSPKSLNEILAVLALAELVYDCVVATGGIPMLVSGDCLLAELNPRVGFLDSSISTSWKALTSFMGF